MGLLEMVVNEVIIDNKRYIFDQEKRMLRRFNEKTKMWINIYCASDESESVVDHLIELLTKEHIRQCMEKIKSPT